MISNSASYQISRFWIVSVAEQVSLSMPTKTGFLLYWYLSHRQLAMALHMFASSKGWYLMTVLTIHYMRQHLISQINLLSTSTPANEVEGGRVYNG